MEVPLLRRATKGLQGLVCHGSVGAVSKGPSRGLATTFSHFWKQQTIYRKVGILCVGIVMPFLRSYVCNGKLNRWGQSLNFEGFSWTDQPQDLSLVLIQLVSFAELLDYEDVNKPTPIVKWGRGGRGLGHKDTHTHIWQASTQFLCTKPSDKALVKDTHQGGIQWDWTHKHTVAKRASLTTQLPLLLLDFSFFLFVFFYKGKRPRFLKPCGEWGQYCWHAP